jgi:magnesium transporter
MIDRLILADRPVFYSNTPGRTEEVISMDEIMNHINRNHFVANFEELVAENQIQTATDMLISAEPDEQILIIREAQPVLLEHFVQALDREDRIEVIDQLTPEARAILLQVLEEVEQQGRVLAPDLPVEDGESAADLIEEAIEESIERAPEPDTTEEEPAEVPGQMHFTIMDEHLHWSKPDAAVVSVYSNPANAAQRVMLETLGIDDHMLESALDPDEISRLEFDRKERQAFLVLKRPYQESNGRPELLGISSIGCLFQPNRLIIVTPDDEPLVDDGDRAETLQMLLLRIMSSIVDEFMLELKRVKRTSREIQSKLNKSIGNRELLRMFSLSEGLVYNINAIEGNGRALRRLRHLSTRLDFEEEELEFLDDIIIDNDQCSRQAEIFSTVLGGMLDARGNIINNNMNILLKNLTIINVVFLPLTLIASIGGMSEYSVWLDEIGTDWPLGYIVFTGAMLVLGLILWWLVSKLVDRWGVSNGAPHPSMSDRLRRKPRE